MAASSSVCGTLASASGRGYVGRPCMEGNSQQAPDKCCRVCVGANTQSFVYEGYGGQGGQAGKGNTVSLGGVETEYRKEYDYVEKIELDMVSTLPSQCDLCAAPAAWRDVACLAYRPDNSAAASLARLRAATAPRSRTCSSTPRRTQTTS